MLAIVVEVIDDETTSRRHDDGDHDDGDHGVMPVTTMICQLLFTLHKDPFHRIRSD